MLKKITLIVSIIAFAYLAYLFLMFYTDTEFPTIAGVVHEMIMIPLLIAVPVFFIVSLVLVIREKFNVRSNSFYSLVLFILSGVFLMLLMKGYVAIEM